MSSDGQYTTLELAPTINKDDTPYKAEGQWVDSNLITFSSTGRVSRFLGWALRSAQEIIIGVARDINIWKEISGRAHYIVGTHEKLQIEQSGVVYDITPVETSASLTNAISTTNTSQHRQQGRLQLRLLRLITFLETTQVEIVASIYLRKLRLLLQ